MTYNEAHVLGILLRHSSDERPMTATDLIRRTRLLKSQMNKVLTTLEKYGFITRVRADADKRMIHIRPTEKGKDAYLEQHKGVEVILSQLIERIGAERALSIASELSVVTEILDELVPLPK
jgi:DNA-binding MarR family transcriptional regulator